VQQRLMDVAGLADVQVAGLLFAVRMRTRPAVVEVRR
jgi:hypothetical protein